MPLFEFDPPARFVAGTVGPPGQRTFFLQAGDGQRLVSVSLEKMQVSVLADRVNDLIDGLAPVAGSEAAAARFVDNAPLDTPIDDEFRVVTLSLAWEEDRERIVIECLDRDPDEDDQEQPAAGQPGTPVVPGVENTLRVVLDPAHARAFARRCNALVAAGRPPCPFCGGPLDADGHICPRANGYRR